MAKKGTTTSLEDETFELRSAIQLMVAAMKDGANKSTAATKEVEANIAAERKARESTQEETDAREKNTEALDASNKALNKAAGAVFNLGKEFINIGKAGLELSRTLGTNATKGVQLELNNRAALVAQIGRVDVNRMVNMEQLAQAEQAMTDVFISTRAGMEVSAEGARQFASNLSGGFNSQFQLTGESLKALTVIGATTTEQMSAFRQATGRASLSSGQLSTIVNKNVTSFLVFGNKFAKAAAEAERTGVSLQAIQGAQENMVSNLDNVVDVTSQLNQLGAGIDFGTFVQKLEQEGPDAVIKYLSSTVPGNLMESTSFRALFNQLGINSEQLLRQQQVGSAADAIEGQMTQAGTAASGTAKALTGATKITDVATDSFGKLVLAIGAATISLIGLSATGLGKGWASQLLGLGRGGAGAAAAGVPGAGIAGPASLLGRAGLAGAGLTVGIGGAMAGRSMVEKGNTKTGIGLGALGGGAGAAMLALALAPVTGGASLLALGAAGGIGALAGGYYASRGMNSRTNDMAGGGPLPMGTPLDDMYSNYGNRTLLTNSGAYQLNNRDTVLAGTNMFKADDLMSLGEGSIRLGRSEGAKAPTSNDTELKDSIRQLINTLQSANTTITIDGSSQSMSRVKLVGVNVTRNVR